MTRLCLIEPLRVWFFLSYSGEQNKRIQVFAHRNSLTPNRGCGGLIAASLVPVQSIFFMHTEDRPLVLGKEAEFSEPLSLSSLPFLILIDPH